MKKFWASGEPFIWLTGGALAIALLMVMGLIGLILYNGLGFFWPARVMRVELKDGKVLTGPVVAREAIPGTAGHHRIKIRVGNRDLYGADFVWVDEANIANRSYPRDVAIIERTEWGILLGTITAVKDGDQVIARGLAPALAELDRRHPDAEGLRRQIARIEKRDIGAINHEQEQIRLDLRKLALRGEVSGPEVEALN